MSGLVFLLLISVAFLSGYWFGLAVLSFRKGIDEQD